MLSHIYCCDSYWNITCFNFKIGVFLPRIVNMDTNVLEAVEGLHTKLPMSYTKTINTSHCNGIKLEEEVAFVLLVILTLYRRAYAMVSFVLSTEYSFLFYFIRTVLKEQRACSQVRQCEH